MPVWEIGGGATENETRKKSIKIYAALLYATIFGHITTIITYVSYRQCVIHCGDTWKKKECVAKKINKLRE